ncbi:MAG: hypothetical protein HY431_01815 [Candidatus Levybacteria bacterium]|nr:hypothetical protein [Candidatus Levybacteria bacterium]
MTAYLRLPFSFLAFWYFEAPFEILTYFNSLNHAFLQLFSLSLMVRTFFKPIKNEYRKGLVGFSIGMGMVVKFFVILATMILFFFLLAFEFTAMFIFLLFPVVTFYLLFI